MLLDFDSTFHPRLGSSLPGKVCVCLFVIRCLTVQQRCASHRLSKVPYASNGEGSGLRPKLTV
jgi:hypothetical protein